MTVRTMRFFSRASVVGAVQTLLRPAKRGQPIAHGILQRATLAVVQNLMRRRLPNVEDRFTLQMVRPDLVRDHDRPPWSMPPVSPSAVRTMPAYRRLSARSLRTGRFAAARAGVPTSVCSGLAWTSPRFRSPERGDTPETTASDAAEPLLCKSAANPASAAKSVWGLASRQTL